MDFIGKEGFVLLIWIAYMCLMYWLEVRNEWLRDGSDSSQSDDGLHIDRSKTGIQ